MGDVVATSEGRVPCEAIEPPGRENASRRDSGPSEEG